MANEAYQEFRLPYFEVEQPIGTFYVTKISHKVLFNITYFDVRRMLKERDFENYLGIQRPLQKHRVAEIKEFVRTRDACFPTNVILSIKERSIAVEQDTLILRNDPEPKDGSPPIYLRDIAKVIDGQHRIAGLEDLDETPFYVPVCLFIDIDVSDEAYLFSTVNLAQTKVNKSLVYDLFDLAKARSPQKTAHTIAVTLDRTEKSPFFHRIKRLGSATPGRLHETITQATLVEALLPHLSPNAEVDRDLYRRGKQPARPTESELRRHIFRGFFWEKNDSAITDILWNYFDAVRVRWPIAWASTAAGEMLNRTNGVKALMRFLPHSYLFVGGIGAIPQRSAFLKVFQKVKLKDDDFNVERFKPGTSGEALLYSELVSQGLGGVTKLG